MRRVGLGIFGVVLLLAAFAPVLAPNDVAHPFADRTYAPPTWLHLVDADGWHAPFVYRQVMVNRLMRTSTRTTSPRACRCAGFGTAA